MTPRFREKVNAYNEPFCEASVSSRRSKKIFKCSLGGEEEVGGWGLLGNLCWRLVGCEVVGLEGWGIGDWGLGVGGWGVRLRLWDGYNVQCYNYF